MRILTVTLIAGLTLGLAACGGQAPAPSAPPAATATSAPAPATPAALTPGDAYVCPMHPDVTSGTPGQCPKCGMTLVARAEARTPATDTAAHSASDTTPKH